MSFLYPAFLFALSAVAIPIIIHLFSFRRYKTVYFSNTRYLREVKEQTDSRNRLKHLLVLLCRILAITFLVLAFAQPYLRKGTIAETTGRKTVSIYLDNSFSMGLTLKDVPLLELAKRKAEDLVGAYHDDDLFQVLTNNFDAKQQRLIDKQEALNEIKAVQLSPVSHSLDEVLQRQQEALSKGSAARYAYLISDFQKSFLQGSPKPDSGIIMNLVPLQSHETANQYIDTCWFESPQLIAGQTAELYVRIMNHSAEAVDHARLTLKINNQLKAISDYSADPGEAAIDTIVFNVTDKGWNRAELSIVDHPITFDDSYDLSFFVPQHIGITVINGSSSNAYLNALFAADSFFTLRKVSYHQLNYADLAGQQLVILNGIGNISSGLADQLKTLLEQGSNVCVFPPRDADVNAYNAFFASVDADRMNAFVPAAKQVTSLNRHDALFKNVFQRIPQNLALPAATGSFSFSGRIRTTSSPLLLFNDGSAMMSKYEKGQGLLYVSGVPLDKEFSDLPLNALFAPMMYNMAITRAMSSANAYVIGNNNSALIGVTPGKDEQLLKLKGNNVEFIPPQRRTGSNVIVFLTDGAMQSGFYSLQQPDGQSQDWLAMNYNRKESNLTFLEAGSLKTLAASLHAGLFDKATADLTSAITGAHMGIPLWKFAIMLSLLFIALEILLLRLWK